MLLPTVPITDPVTISAAADLLGITLLDHLILADERCYSFADQGWPGV